MQHSFSTVRSTPIVLSSSVEGMVYGLFALAVGLTATGVFVGMQYASTLLTSGMYMFLMIAELAIVFTSRWWANRSPLNVILFFLFPFFSGITLTPFILMVSTGYVNGNAILLNALAATTFMAGAAAVFARTTKWNLGMMGRGLLFALLGFLGIAILQLFIPALRTTQGEMLISGAGVLLFAVFTAYDIQRIQRMSVEGASPFLMALSLYLDIYNLFLMVVRFMLAVSGNRRD